MKIFLFDMDGVLLESHGYYFALQETIRSIGKTLGFRDATITIEDISTFEAGGINNEWDEAAICTALLLEIAWKIDPKQDLPEIPAPVSSPAISIIPDFKCLALELSSPELINIHPLSRAKDRFLSSNHLSNAQQIIIKKLIAEARNPSQSITHRIFQELVLGSSEFSHAYGMPARLNCESYLCKYDAPNLSRSESENLENYIYSTGKSAVIVTSRPCKNPDILFSTPEAEMGADLVGFKNIPIVGWGGITWLAEQCKVDPQTIVKPSAIHALAALRVALGDDQKKALVGSAKLVDAKDGADAWKQLDGAQVSIYEDTPGGITSLQEAQKILAEHSIILETRYYGIASNPIKREALRAVGANLYPSISQALSASM